MGIFRRTKDDRRGPTEHAVTGPSADNAAHGLSRAAGNTDTTARKDPLGTASKVIGPSAPVAGVVDGDGEGTDALPSDTSRGTVATRLEATRLEKETPVESDDHVTRLEKVEEDVEKEEEDESKYPKGISLAILTFGLCMATFVVSTL